MQKRQKLLMHDVFACLLSLLSMYQEKWSPLPLGSRSGVTKMEGINVPISSSILGFQSGEAQAMRGRRIHALHFLGLWCREVISMETYIGSKGPFV